VTTIEELTEAMSRLSFVNIDGEELAFTADDFDDLHSRQNPVDVKFPPGKMHFCIIQEEGDPLGRLKIFNIHPRCPCFAFLQEGDILLAINEWVCESQSFQSILDKIKSTHGKQRVIRVGRLEMLKAHAAPLSLRETAQPPPPPRASAQQRNGGRTASVPSRLIGTSVCELQQKLQDCMDSYRFQIQRVGEPAKKWSHVHGHAAYDKKQIIYQSLFEWATMTDFEQLRGKNGLPSIHMAVVEIEYYAPTTPTSEHRKKPSKCLLQKPKIVFACRDPASATHIASALENIQAGGWVPENVNDFEFVYAHSVDVAIETTIGSHEKKKVASNMQNVAEMVKQQFEEDGDANEEGNGDQHHVHFDGNTPYRHH